MKSEEKILLCLACFLVVLVVGIGVGFIVYELGQKSLEDKLDQLNQENEQLSTVEELVISNITMMSIQNVYATSDECSDVLQKIKDKHWENINKSKYKNGGELAWYAAGLVLGAHHVAKDCNGAEKIIDEILADIQHADHELGQSDIRDDIAASMRFVKKMLNE